MTSNLMSALWLLPDLKVYLHFLDASLQLLLIISVQALLMKWVSCVNHSSPQMYICVYSRYKCWYWYKQTLCLSVWCLVHVSSQVGMFLWKLFNYCVTRYIARFVCCNCLTIQSWRSCFHVIYLMSSNAFCYFSLSLSPNLHMWLRK